MKISKITEMDNESKSADSHSTFSDKSNEFDDDLPKIKEEVNKNIKRRNTQNFGKEEELL